VEVSQYLTSKLYYSDIVIKMVWYSTKTDMTSETEDPNINLHNYNHLIFDKEAQNTCWRKDNLFNK
jgi:hypothetical protein